MKSDSFPKIMLGSNHQVAKEMIPLNTFALLAFFLKSHETKAHPKNEETQINLLCSLI